MSVARIRCVAFLVLGIAAVSVARPDDHPDFNGLWQVTPATAINGGVIINGARETLAPTDGSPLPLQPWAAALHGGFIRQSKAQVEWPPNNQHCLPAGTLRAMKANFPWRWITTADAVLLLFEEDNRIALFRFRDAHPVNLKPSWSGDAIAHWEGETLVVDVTGFNGKTPLPMAIAHTMLLHVVHRFRLISEGRQLEDRILIDDAGTFTRPFETISVFDRQPDDYKLADYRCAENNLDMPRPIAWWDAPWGPG